ncbi:MAG: chemotaxis protein CheW [Geobacteraceae bacterium]|nr:chemotaxis protein CheW [Geobacteraceae bacterium]NTW79915.1 chemotaxis protein CheW [Geobacteraceae bacterium]
MTQHNRKFLVFSIQGSLFALDLSQVSEVGDKRPQLWPIPLAPACYRGAMNYHGDIVAVMDLANFLGMCGHSRCEKIIILHQDVASLAFLIDTVVRIIPEEDASISLCSTPESEFTAAKLGLIDGEAILLDLGLLVQKAEIGMHKNQ